MKSILIIIMIMIFSNCITTKELKSKTDYNSKMDSIIESNKQSLIIDFKEDYKK
jgi:hypothetical protein